DRTGEASAFLEDFLKKLAESDEDGFPEKNADRNRAYVVSILAMIDAKQGNRDRAKVRIEKAAAGEKRFIDSHHVSYDIGCAYALLGEKKLAMQWLKNSAEDGNPCYPCFKDDRNLD